MVGANQALDAALALARAPTLASAMRRQPLPPGVPDLLRILAGEDGVAAQAAAFRGLDERQLRFALEAYVQQVMLFPSAAAERVLGVNPGASRAEMRLHMRWLMNWLHPDHNQADWRSGFASRVLAAWRELSSRRTGVQPPAIQPVPARSSQSRRSPARRPPRIPWVARPVAPSPRRRPRHRRRLGMSVALFIFLIAVAIPGDSPSVLWSALMSPAEELTADAAPAKVAPDPGAQADAIDESAP